MLNSIRSSFRESRGTWIVLACIVFVAGWLRFYHLGIPPLERNHDEDIMATAVLGILEHGYPLMPGGMVYLRSVPLLYLMSGSVELFGFSEFTLRLPATVFGLLLVPLGYLVARRFFGQGYGVAAAVLIAISLWEVDVSRTARMYTPFAFFYTLTLYGICRGYFEKSLAWRWAAIPLAVLTIALHRLGFSLCAVFVLAAVVVPQVTVITRLGALGSAALAGSWFFFLASVGNAGFYRPRILASLTTVDDAVESGGASLLSAITSRLYFPEEILFAKPEISVRLLLIAGLIGAALLLAFLLRRSPILRRPWTMLFLVLCVLAGTMQQFSLAALLFVTFVLVQGRGWQAMLYPYSLSIGAFLGAFFVGWYFVTVSGQAGVELGTYGTFRVLLDYPRAVVIRHFVVNRPFISILACAGMIAAVHRASIQKLMTPQAFLVVTVIVALGLHGFFQSQFRPRYNFNLDVVYLVFAAAGAGLVATFVADRFRSTAKIQNNSTAPVFVLPVIIAMLVGWPDIRPDLSVAYVHGWQKVPSRTGERYSIQKLIWPADRKTTAAFVKEHSVPEDEVLTMDWMTSYVYAGRVDYWLQAPGHFEEVSYRDGNNWREMYLGALIVPDSDALEHLLAEPCRSTLWIVTSGWIIKRQAKKISPEIMEVINGLNRYLVYRGLDGVSAVYKVPAQTHCQPIDLEFD